ncbi:MAG: CDP-diacylglycerol--serine O-phosphatidyltransferase [Nitrospinales bacterium]
MKIRKGIYILPSLFTTGNIFCGFYTFVAVLNEEFYLAAWAIVLAIVFDGLDGRVARLTKTTSKFGVQFDSLADIISFGMAPAFMVFSWKLKPFGRIGWMAAFLFLICGALRLARFNTMKSDEDEDGYFNGLPIPGAAAVIASIVILSEDRIFTQFPPVFLVVIVYVLAFLMVSNIKYPAFKKVGLKARVPFARFLFVVLVFYLFATIPRLALAFVSFSYALFGPLRFLVLVVRKKTAPNTSATRNRPEKF